MNVFADYLQLAPHPKTPRLLIGQVGDCQVVLGNNGIFRHGQLVVVAKAGSTLPPDLVSGRLFGTSCSGYLKPPSYDTVHSFTVKGFRTEGMILPMPWVRGKFDQEFGLGHDLPIGQELSETLGIHFNIPTAQPSLWNRFLRWCHA